MGEVMWRGGGAVCLRPTGLRAQAANFLCLKMMVRSIVQASPSAEMNEQTWSYEFSPQSVYQLHISKVKARLSRAPTTMPWRDAATAEDCPSNGATH